MHPTGNGSFTGSCPVWPTRDYLRANTWCVLPANPHCSASSIYSTPINQRANEAQEGEGDEEGEEGGDVGIHVSFRFLLLHITQLALKQFAARDGGLSKKFHR